MADLLQTRLLTLCLGKIRDDLVAAQFLGTLIMAS